MHMATFSFNLLTDGRVLDPDLIAPVSQHRCDPPTCEVLLRGLVPELLRGTIDFESL